MISQANKEKQLWEMTDKLLMIEEELRIYQEELLTQNEELKRIVSEQETRITIQQGIMGVTHVRIKDLEQIIQAMTRIFNSRKGLNASETT